MKPLIEHQVFGVKVSFFKLSMRRSPFGRFQGRSDFAAREIQFSINFKRVVRAEMKRIP